MVELPRRERERERHRQEILNEAEAVFAEKGFHGATMQAVAERAEFSVGYLYSHFDSKEDIFLRLIDARVDEFLEDVHGRLRDGLSPLQKVETAIQGKTEFFRTHRRFFTIMFTYAEAEDRAGVLISGEAHRRYHEYVEELSRVFARGVEEGTFIEADPMALAACAEGLTNAAIGHWLHMGDPEAEPTKPALIREILLRGMLRRADGG